MSSVQTLYIQFKHVCCALLSFRLLYNHGCCLLLFGSILQYYKRFCKTTAYFVVIQFGLKALNIGLHFGKDFTKLCELLSLVVRTTDIALDLLIKTGAEAVLLTAVSIIDLDELPLRVLSIRIEKKVNYFYEVTTSD